MKAFIGSADDQFLITPNFSFDSFKGIFIIVKYTTIEMLIYIFILIYTKKPTYNIIIKVLSLTFN